MSDLHRRVRDHAILAGIMVTTADVEAIDELLIEERRLAAAQSSAGGGARGAQRPADAQGMSLTHSDCDS